MVPIPEGKILSACDRGTIWQLFYEIDGNGPGVVNFDWRCLANFYEGATGRSFYDDYKFGAGREYISKHLRGRRVSVEGDPFNQTVRLEDGD